MTFTSGEPPFCSLLEYCVNMFTAPDRVCKAWPHLARSQYVLATVP